ncbi:MAG: radical SAM protein, partial [Chloroflexi bacterium]|nr:radical SAM protein [Chloroflexota bacterium]
MTWKWKPREQARALLAQEQGAIVKDWGGRLPLVLAYPNRYSVGMGNLGLHLLYRLLNDQPQVVCERAFASLASAIPSRGDDLWVGQDQRLRNVGPILSLETQRPLSEFPVVAFSVPYELDYPHLVAMLRASGIPLLAEERQDGDPLVLAGGMALTANPEPMAAFLDAMVIGEAEPVLPGLLDALREALGGPRADLLQRLAEVPGVYVPGHYQAAYGPQGQLSSLSHRGQVWRPPSPLPGAVTRQVQHNLDQEPAHTAVFSRRAEFGDLFLLEVSRGCGRGCAFCLTGHNTRPVRYRSLETLLATARQGLAARESIGLLGAAVSDHPQIDELVEQLRRMGARLSVSSWRADALSEPLLRGLQESGAQSITLAPEAGSQRLRRRIAKPITDEQLIHAAQMASKLGLRQIKLYFMVGLPGETEEDVEAIADLAGRLASHSNAKVVAGISPFVPKAQTAFQRQPMLEAAALKRRLHALEQALARQA